MIKRIDLFLPPKSQYGVLHHFTHSLCDALNAIGVNAKILEAEFYNPGPFLEAIVKDPPDCTLSFNGLLPDERGRFFCDTLGIPHVACIVDSQNLFIQMIHSPLTIIACSDQGSSEFFQGLKAKNTLFMPHGVDEIRLDNTTKRIYPVTVCSSLIDYEKNKAEWEEKYDKVVRKAMEAAAEETLAGKTNYIQALVNAIDAQMELNYQIDPNKIDFISVMDDLEMYIKGRCRIDSIKAIKDAEVHIFGSTPAGASWEDYLGKENKNYIIHEAIPYEQVLDVLKQTRILLNATHWVQKGSHERVFDGLSSGALVFTNPNPYMDEHFEDEKNIVFYHLNNPVELNQKINKYLSDENKRAEVAEAGRKIVQENHTWEVRARTLVHELEPILQKMREAAEKKQAALKDVIDD